MTASADIDTPPNLTAHQRALQRWFPGITGDADDWRAQALCAQVDPEIFFPEQGASSRPAKSVCAACPVQAECLEAALANDEAFGIWGGLTTHERMALRQNPSLRTHCRNGHEFTPQNTRISAAGIRRCRECVNVYQRDVKRRRQADGR